MLTEGSESASRSREPLVSWLVPDRTNPGLRWKAWFNTAWSNALPDTARVLNVTLEESMFNAKLISGGTGASPYIGRIGVGPFCHPALMAEMFILIKTLD